ncbi:MAG: hypothetical protein IJ313_02565 [Clostridia bacterium]|nr:hypothetical protein [Clostridia bacterium]
MDKILQELYHGMIHPEEEYQPRGEEHCRKIKEIAAQKAALLEKLEQNNLELRREVEALLDATNAADAVDMEEAYIQGMRMGAKLALALLGERGA